MEPFAVNPPLIADRTSLLVGGLCERYTTGNIGAIPSQW